MQLGNQGNYNVLSG